MKKVFVISFLCFACILMIFASFFDLSLSQNFFVGENFFSLLFVFLAEIPLYFFIAFCLNYLGFRLFKKKTKLYLFIAFVFLFGSFLTFGIYFFVCFNLTIFEDVCFALVLFSVNLTLSFYLDLLYGQKLVKFCVFTLLFCCTIFLLNQGIKIIWGRVRFCDLIALNNFELFSPWYQINGYNGNKSFYSGHTTSAMSLICFFVLMEFYNVKKSYKMTFSAFFILFVFLTLVSRIIIGAHFLSDVVFAVIICLSLYLLLKWFFLKKHKVYFDKLCLLI